MSTNCSNLPHVLARSCKGRSIKQTSPAGRSAFKGFTRGPSSFWPWTWTHASSNDNAPSLSQRLCRKLSMKDNSTAAMWEYDAEVWRRRIEMRTMKPRTLQPDYEERRKKHDQKNIGKKAKTLFQMSWGPARPFGKQIKLEKTNKHCSRGFGGWGGPAESLQIFVCFLHGALPKSQNTVFPRFFLVFSMRPSTKSLKLLFFFEAFLNECLKWRPRFGLRFWNLQSNLHIIVIIF